jgi:hypothetical protein
MSTIIIKHEGRDWKVTPFHCVVGPIAPEHFVKIRSLWIQHFGAHGQVLIVHRNVFNYLAGWAKAEICRLRDLYSNDKFLFYCQDPLLVNELAPEEVSLAVVEKHDRLVLTNFSELPEIKDSLRIRPLGAFWATLATGGIEERLRKGGA